MTDNSAYTTGLAECCLHTVAIHGKNNTMMTCPTCEKIIKSFRDTPAFRNYRQFCLSKGRKFAEAEETDCHLIAFDRPV